VFILRYEVNEKQDAEEKPLELLASRKAVTEERQVMNN
jgi:hypothetical protein